MCCLQPVHLACRSSVDLLMDHIPEFWAWAPLLACRQQHPRVFSPPICLMPRDLLALLFDLKISLFWKESHGKITKIYRKSVFLKLIFLWSKKNHLRGFSHIYCPFDIIEEVFCLVFYFKRKYFILLDHILSETICLFCFCVLFSNIYTIIKFNP